MSKKIYRMSILAYSGPPVVENEQGLPVTTGSKELDTVVVEYELFDDETGKRVPTVAGPAVGQFTIPIPVGLLEDAWAAAIEIIEAEENI